MPAVKRARHTRFKQTLIERGPLVALLVACCTFFCFAILSSTYPGLQYDELLFADPLYAGPGLYHVHIAGKTIPLMLMSYLGALKTWLYAIPLGVFKPSTLAIRLPVVLTGVVVLVGLYATLLRLVNARTALIAVGLLATDALFVLTTTMDWGPVALQHLLFVLACFLIVKFGQLQLKRYLSAAAFCCGLGVWDKAVFLWLLTGCVLSAAFVFRREIKSLFTPVLLAIAGCCFLIGSAPLLWYNIKADASTIRSNAVLSAHSIPPKLPSLISTLDGSGLFGYLVYDDWSGPGREPRGPIEDLSFLLRRLAGEHQHNVMTYLVVACLIGGFFVLRGLEARLAAFCLIAFIIGWLQMAATERAGDSVHHVILLWPLPHVFVALVLGRIADTRSWLAWTVVVFALLANVLQMNQYLYQLARNGSPSVWSDGTANLAAALRDYPSPVAVYDWGLSIPLAVHSKGKTQVLDASVLRSLLNEGSPDDLRRLNAENPYWVAWVTGNEAFAGVNSRVEELASRVGLAKQPVHIIEDKHGRPIIQIFRFIPTPALTATRELSYDDSDSEIHFIGPWTKASQFTLSCLGTLTYSNVPGATARLRFVGTSITYLFTKAFNRGWASVSIDDSEVDQLDLYSSSIKWRARKTYSGLAPGGHTIEITVRGKRSPGATGNFIDIDALIPGDQADLLQAHCDVPSK